MPQLSYPPSWHLIFGDQTGDSARTILPPLLQQFDVGSLVEVGCGNAHWTQAAIDAGVEDYVVVDGPWNRHEDLLVDIDRFTCADLAKPLHLGRRFDLAICLEVAEHVPEDSAGVLIDSLITAADVVLFGAAIPLQGGHGHINEQWPSWWRKQFEARGYTAYDLVRPLHWQDQSIHYWYRQNTFVYVADANKEATAIAQAASGPGPAMLIDAVHPEKYASVAGYEGIFLGRLARRLPVWALGRIRSKLGGRG